MSHDSAENETKSMDEKTVPSELQEDFEILTAKDFCGEVFALRLRPHRIPVQRQFLPLIRRDRAVGSVGTGSDLLEQRNNLILRYS